MHIKIESCKQHRWFNFKGFKNLSIPFNLNSFAHISWEKNPKSMWPCYTPVFQILGISWNSQPSLRVLGRCVFCVFILACIDLFKLVYTKYSPHAIVTRFSYIQFEYHLMQVTDSEQSKDTVFQAYRYDSRQVQAIHQTPDMIAFKACKIWCIKMLSSCIINRFINR